MTNLEEYKSLPDYKKLEMISKARVEREEETLIEYYKTTPELFNARPLYTETILMDIVCHVNSFENLIEMIMKNNPKYFVEREYLFEGTPLHRIALFSWQPEYFFELISKNHPEYLEVADAEGETPMGLLRYQGKHSEDD